MADDPIPIGDRIKELVLVISNVETGRFVRSIRIDEAMTSRKDRDRFVNEVGDLAVAFLSAGVASYRIDVAFLSPAEIRKLGGES